MATSRVTNSAIAIPVTARADLPWLALFPHRPRRAERQSFAAMKGRLFFETNNDGNSFFAAMTLLLNQRDGTHITHDVVRREAIAYLRDNPEICNSGSPIEHLDEYLLDMGQDSRFATGPILEATARKYNTSIIIYRLPSGEDIILNEAERNRSTLKLIRTKLAVHQHGERHYDALLPFAWDIDPIDESGSMPDRFRSYMSFGSQFAQIINEARDNNEIIERIIRICDEIVNATGLIAWSRFFHRDLGGLVGILREKKIFKLIIDNSHIKDKSKVFKLLVMLIDFYVHQISVEDISKLVTYVDITENELEMETEDRFPATVNQWISIRSRRILEVYTLEQVIEFLNTHFDNRVFDQTLGLDIEVQNILDSLLCTPFGSVYENSAYNLLSSRNDVENFKILRWCYESNLTTYFEAILIENKGEGNRDNIFAETPIFTAYTYGLEHLYPYLVPRYRDRNANHVKLMDTLKNDARWSWLFSSDYSKAANTARQGDIDFDAYLSAKAINLDGECEDIDIFRARQNYLRFLAKSANHGNKTALGDWETWIGLILSIIATALSVTSGQLPDEDSYKTAKKALDIISFSIFLLATVLSIYDVYKAGNQYVNEMHEKYPKKGISKILRENLLEPLNLIYNLILFGGIILNLLASFEITIIGEDPSKSIVTNFAPIILSSMLNIWRVSYTARVEYLKNSYFPIETNAVNTNSAARSSGSEDLTSQPLAAPRTPLPAPVISIRHRSTRAPVADAGAGISLN